MADAPRIETWESWMARALHDPVTGYYTAHVPAVGPRGDFSTSATLGLELAHGISRWLRQRVVERRWQGRVPVIEVGPGTGTLACAVLDALPWWFRWRIDLHLVETSKPLREAQERTLRGRRVRWHTDMTGALGATNGRGLIYANELIDAFPCRCFIRRTPGWAELAVIESRPGVWQEGEVIPADGGPVGAWLASLRNGQRIETHPAYQRWLQNWAPAWRDGSFLTIDYGYTTDPTPRLPLSGTLRAYFRHLRLEGDEVYQRMGRQDLTADVNFSEVQSWGECLGWRTVVLESQADWLGRWSASSVSSKARSRLSNPGDAGGAFLVLEQSTAERKVF